MNKQIFISPGAHIVGDVQLGKNNPCNIVVFRP